MKHTIEVVHPDSENGRGPGRRAASAWLLFLLLLPLASSMGCRLGEPGSASFAAVVIHNHPPQEIAELTQQVFREDGYAGGFVTLNSLLFQKEGSRMNNLAYEGVVGTHEGAQTAVRVKGQLVSLGDNSFRLQCQAYMVRGAGDAFFEEETRVANFRRGPYQKLLDKVADKLK